MSIFFSLWPLFGYLTYFSENPNRSYFWVRWAYASVSFFTVTFYSFFAYFFKEENRFKPFRYFVCLGGIVFVFLSFFSDFIVKGIILQEVGVKPIFNFGAFLFYLYVLVIFLFVFVRFYKNYLSSGPKKREKILYFFIGTSIFLVMNTIFNIILPLITGTYEHHQFGNYAAIFLLGFTAYAIVRHELFDMKVIATEAVTIVLWIILISKLFVSESSEEFLIDFLVVVLTVIFGTLLIRSVSREVRQRKELEKLTERLKRLDKQKDEFISVAAHELRSPVTAVKGYLSMVMEGDGGKIPEKAKEFLQDASLSSERMVRLINNLLDVGRIEEGRIVYEMGDVKLSEVIEGAYKEFTLEAKEKNLEMQLEIKAGKGDIVHVDKDRIYEVISNFLGNAVKFTNQGKITITMLKPNTERIRVEVTDTGPGINAKDQEKLFQKFYRAEKTSAVGGTGLGLYVSRLLIEKFGGTIGVTSEEGKGSTFWFELPVV